MAFIKKIKFFTCGFFLFLPTLKKAIGSIESALGVKFKCSGWVQMNVHHWLIDAASIDPWFTFV